MTSFVWSNNEKLTDNIIPLTKHSFFEKSENLSFNFRVLTLQSTETTSTSSSTNSSSTTSSSTSSGGGNNSGTSSNTCPQAWADQPRLSFSVDQESFDFPLTELYCNARKLVVR